MQTEIFDANIPTHNFSVDDRTNEFTALSFNENYRLTNNTSPNSCSHIAHSFPKEAFIKTFWQTFVEANW